MLHARNSRETGGDLQRQQSTLEYMADMMRSLRQIALENDLQTLADLLGVARREAELRASDLARVRFSEARARQAGDRDG